MTAYVKETVREPGPSRLELLELVNKRQGWVLDYLSLRCNSGMFLVNAGFSHSFREQDVVLAGHHKPNSR